MKLMVLTAAVFPTEEDARRKLWIFLRSAERAGVPREDLHLYGIGRTFPGYRQMCMDFLLEYLKSEKARGYTTVLYHDGWDGMFCAPLSEIVSKYQVMGSPSVLMSAYIGLGNESDMTKYVGCFDESIPYRYPNRGGFIADIPVIVEAFERMLAQDGLTGDDCFEHYRAWREGWFRPQLDSGCEIFQVSDVNAIVEPNVHYGSIYETRAQTRLINTVTKSHPCILHLSGGFSDPETGKDAAMIPWARALEIL